LVLKREREYRAENYNGNKRGGCMCKTRYTNKIFIMQEKFSIYAKVQIHNDQVKEPA